MYNTISEFVINLYIRMVFLIHSFLQKGHNNSIVNQESFVKLYYKQLTNSFKEQQQLKTSKDFLFIKPMCSYYLYYLKIVLYIFL